MRKFLAGAVLLIGAFSAIPAYADGAGAVTGSFVGAGVGGLIGNQLGRGPARGAATVAGVIFGGLIGNDIGSGYDYESRYAGDGLYGPSYTDAPITYAANYTPNYVAPPAPPPESIAYYDTVAQTYCREVTENVPANGGVEEDYGTACLQPDGTWRVLQ